MTYTGLAFPKPKCKKGNSRRPKNNPRPTINDICRYTGKPYASTHEVFFGTGERQLSIMFGMQVKVSNDIHRQIHDNPLTGLDLELKREFQTKFVEKHGYDMYMKTFGRDYYFVEG